MTAGRLRWAWLVGGVVPLTMGCNGLLGIQELSGDDGGAADGPADVLARDAGEDADAAPDTGNATDGPGTDAPGAEAGGGADASEGGGCATSDLLCDGGCVANDLQNCGACGHDCTDLPQVSGPVTCTSGVCSFPQSACAAGWAHCSADPDQGCETNITTPSHCGSCTNTCTGAMPVCSSSGSTYECGSACAPGTTPCGTAGSCVDTTSNPSDCKTCGNVCTTNVGHALATCVASACAFSCNAGYTACGGLCVDETSDAANCGACGEGCAVGGQCVDSACQCPAGTRLCGSSCLADNAEACGTTCIECTAPANGTPTCDGTSCGFTCSSPYLSCSGACVDAKTDDDNCGACGNECPDGFTCSAGVCTSDCPAGQTYCTPVGAAAHCADLTSDPANCGLCGMACTAGEICEGSVCQIAGKNATLVQALEGGVGGGTTMTALFTLAQAAGDLNVVVVGWLWNLGSPFTIGSVRDTAGNIYAQACLLNDTDEGLAIWYSTDIKAAPAGNAVTVSFTGSSSTVTADGVLSEWSGGAWSFGRAATFDNTAGGATPSFPITTSSKALLIAALFSQNDSTQYTSNMTLLGAEGTAATPTWLQADWMQAPSAGTYTINPSPGVVDELLGAAAFVAQ